MGQAGRAWVLEHYAIEQVLGMATAFYKSMLEPEAQRNQVSGATALAAVPD
jgi:hypothetical protein